MIHLFELKQYKENELKRILNVDDSKWKEISDELLRKNIIQYENNSVKFKYVGIIMIYKFTIFILPKYQMFEKRENYDVEIKSLINLFNNFSRREKLDREVIEDIDVYSEELDNKFISIVLFLMEDYFENGIYHNEVHTVERDGAGEVNWDRTIDEVMALNIKGNFLYPELITNCISNDFYHLISKIHRIVIKECIDFIESTGLKYIINSEIELDERLIDYSIEIDSLRYEIEKEIRVQFNDQKRKILYAILAYLDEKTSVGNEKLLLYGTKNFKWVWEEICSVVFKNQFVTNAQLNKYDEFMLLPPKWSIYDYDQNAKISEDNTEISMKKNRLTPDILRVLEFQNKKYLLILDAKYYNIRTIKDDKNELKIMGNPGIGDITKQYCYHMALTDYIEKNNINNVVNAFLFPSVSSTEIIGNVNLNFMDITKYPDIMLIKINVQDIIQMYCKNKFYSEEELELLLLGHESRVITNE